MTTPHVHDSGIQALIQKYPPKALKDMEGSQEEKDALHLKKKQIEKMIKIIDGIEYENKVDKEKVMYDQLVQTIKADEFMNNVNRLKDLDFAEGMVLQTLFDYKIKDEQDQIDLAQDVAKEYHSGKLDPGAAIKMQRKRKAGQVIRKPGN